MKIRSVVTLARAISITRGDKSEIVRTSEKVGVGMLVQGKGRRCLEKVHWGKRDGNNLRSCVSWTNAPKSDTEDRSAESKEGR